MEILIIICFSVGLAFIIVGVWMIVEGSFSGILPVLSGLIFITVSIIWGNNPKDKENPITLHTPRDTYYIYEDSLTTESDRIYVPKGEWKKAYIELITIIDSDSTINNGIK